MTPIESFIPEVLPWARGASDLAITNAVRDTAQDFCRRSRSWRVWIDNISIIANQRMVGLAPPQDSQVIEVKRVAYQGRNLESINNSNLRSYGLDDPTRLGTAPQLFDTTIDGTGAVALTIAPLVGLTIANAMRAQVILEPTRDAVTLPDYLYRRFARGIGYGAIAMLNEMGDEWCRPDLVGLNRDKYEVEIGAAIGWAETNATSDSRRVKAHYL